MFAVFPSRVELEIDRVIDTRDRDDADLGDLVEQLFPLDLNMTEPTVDGPDRVGRHHSWRTADTPRALLMYHARAGSIDRPLRAEPQPVGPQRRC